MKVRVRNLQPGDRINVTDRYTGETRVMEIETTRHSWDGRVRLKFKRGPVCGGAHIIFTSMDSRSVVTVVRDSPVLLAA